MISGIRHCGSSQCNVAQSCLRCDIACKLFTCHVKLTQVQNVEVWPKSSCIRFGACIVFKSFYSAYSIFFGRSFFNVTTEKLVYFLVYFEHKTFSNHYRCLYILHILCLVYFCFQAFFFFMMTLLFFLLWFFFHYCVYFISSFVTLSGILSLVLQIFQQLSKACIAFFFSICQDKRISALV